MIADIETPPALTVKDFKGHTDPDWCPGCGDFGVLHALKTAIAELGLHPNEVLTISGIGCSSNLPGYINTYGMHTLHGRALAVATGAQLANHKMKVIVTGGDGDGYGIGGNHFLHTMRRNVDLTYIVMDNQVYGLTTGQVRHLTELIKGGIQHKGFSLIDTFSPCVTFNRDNTHEFFKQRTQKLEDQGHDPTDFSTAMARGYEWGDRIPIGLFWKRDDLLSLDQLEPVLDDDVPLARRPLGVDAETGRALVRELM